MSAMETAGVTPPTVSPRKERDGIRSAYRGIDLNGGGAKVWQEPTPTMTGQEALAAAKKLWRKFAGRQWPGRWRIGRGNHRIYPRGTVMLVNPGLGWQRFVHDLSHTLYDHMTRGGHSVFGPRLNVKGVMKPILSKAVYQNYRTAKKSDHSDDHAQLEKAMVAMVIESGWLTGVLRKPAVIRTPKPSMVEVSAKAKPSRRERNEGKVDAAILRWQDKLKKAEKAVKAAEKRLKELTGKKRYYDRQRAK